MFTLLLLAASSFLLALLLTPFCRNRTLRWGFVDCPDAGRKAHPRPVPRTGGVPLALAYLGAFGFAALIGNQMPHGGWSAGLRLFPAPALVFLVGLADDLWGLKPWQKLAGQVAAAVMAFFAGVHITQFGPFHTLWIGLPVTVLWLVACANAFNLIDGVDGLAAGVGLFATTTTLVAALIQNNFALALVTVPLAGALLGFLRYNFNPASIFLGDSGSLLIGFLLGCYGILWSQKSATMLGMTAPLMALSIPLLDTALAIVRRFLRRQPIFGADRGHIHHKLLARGLTPRRVALMFYGISGLAAAFSLLQSMVHAQYGGLVVILFCAVAWIGVQHLGYPEIGMAGRLMFRGAFRGLLNAHLDLDTFRENLSAAATPDECWNVIQPAYATFGFNKIKLQIHHRFYTDTTNGHHAPRTWTLRIRLSDDDYAELAREFDTQAPPIVAEFADSIAEILAQKHSEFANFPGFSTARPKIMVPAAGPGSRVMLTFDRSTPGPRIFKP
jgi:UDP-GlcNAc:undecaprenyl-phosphate GlcNAc-1-phosphate transferase